MREPARTPDDARKRYQRILGDSLSCLSPTASWYVGPSLDRASDDDYSLLFRNRSIVLKRQNLPSLNLTCAQRFSIIPDPREGFEGEWKANTLAYIYTVENSDGEMFSWHWHPFSSSARPEPHLHVRGSAAEFGNSLHKVHIPTGRVAFEDVVRFLIADLGVKHGRRDWDSVLAESIFRFRKYRTWA